MERTGGRVCFIRSHTRTQARMCVYDPLFTHVYDRSKAMSEAELRRIDEHTLDYKIKALEKRESGEMELQGRSGRRVLRGCSPATEILRGCQVRRKRAKR